MFGAPARLSGIGCYSLFLPLSRENVTKYYLQNQFRNVREQRKLTGGLLLALQGLACVYSAHFASRGRTHVVSIFKFLANGIKCICHVPVGTDAKKGT
jgi:hypothetical protein